MLITKERDKIQSLLYTKDINGYIYIASKEKPV